jgi:hypothetical protein
MSDWQLADTNTHQDHVIAHVIGASVEAYFAWDETAYLVLDIGFIWNIYLNGEMGLVPSSLAISELAATDNIKTELGGDMDAISTGAALQLMTRASAVSPIQNVDFFARDYSRRLVLTCDAGELVVETSLETAEVTFHER